MTTIESPTVNKFHRHNGPFGGVAAGLGRTFGINAGFLRLAIFASGIVFGPIVLAIYVALWYAMPVDPTVPVADRPDKPPIVLVVLLALIFGLGFVFDFAFGLLTLVGSIGILGWVVIAALIFVIARSRS